MSLDIEKYKQRLFKHSIPEPNSGCWIWTGAVMGRGYGYMLLGDRLQGAHRASFLLFKGPIPKGMNVCHRCDVRPCVNPDHLFLGTPKQNTEDMISKGRMAIGTRRAAVLDERRISEILSMASLGVRYVEIARKFSICKQLVTNIVTGSTWSHVPGPRQERRTRAKVSEAQRDEIRRLAASGHELSTIASQFGLTKSGIRYVLYGRKGSP